MWSRLHGRVDGGGRSAGKRGAMSEGNQYLVGNLERIAEHIDRRSVYAPALVVLADDQVPSSAREYVERLLDGEGVYWDLPPMTAESWEVYSGLCGFYGQLLRLLCRDVGFDVWPGWRRTEWVTSDWYPLAREFGWKVACRPLGGVLFRDQTPEMPDAARYMASWPHGWLSLDECREYAPYLHGRICELAIDIGLDWDLSTLEQRLEKPEQLDRDERFEINNLCAGRRSRKVWQFQRGFALFEAMREAIDREQDLISVGY